MNHPLKSGGLQASPRLQATHDQIQPPVERLTGLR